MIIKNFKLINKSKKQIVISLTWSYLKTYYTE
jgi:hypothetical protein